MIPLSFALFISFVHYIIDFTQQSRWEAENKSKSNLALTSHVLRYTVNLFAIGLLLAAFHVQSLMFISIFCLVSFFCHWITDYCTSRLTSHYWSRKPKEQGEEAEKLQKGRNARMMFIVVGGDQFLHHAQLFLTYYLLHQWNY